MLTLENRRDKFMMMMGKYIPTEFINWLIVNGFFNAPASTKHHGNYEGGLFDHSYAVAETLNQLTKANRLSWDNLRSPFVVGMFHDLCKIDNYIKTENGFDYDKECLIPGHGEKSVIIILQHMSLTLEEIMCIRWHMGAFDDKENWNYYTKAVNQYPNVLWTHQADMIASQILGV
jgi:hypothetical protein